MSFWSTRYFNIIHFVLQRVFSGLSLAGHLGIRVLYIEDAVEGTPVYLHEDTHRNKNIYLKT